MGQTKKNHGANYESQRRLIVNNDQMTEEAKQRKLKQLEETGTISNKAKDNIDVSKYHKAGFIPDPSMDSQQVVDSYKKFMRKQLDEMKKVIRPQLYWSQDAQCNMCNRFMKANEVTVDHIYPLDKGGDNEISNLQLLCDTCNKVKSNMGIVSKQEHKDGTITIKLSPHI